MTDKTQPSAAAPDTNTGTPLSGMLPDAFGNKLVVADMADKSKGAALICRNGIEEWAFDSAGVDALFAHLHLDNGKPPAATVFEDECTLQKNLPRKSTPPAPAAGVKI